MRRLMVLILTVSILGQSLGALWVFVGFYSNREYISENLCTYRYQKINTCRGECILVKNLIDVQKQEEEKPNLKITDTLVLFAPSEYFVLEFSFPDPENFENSDFPTYENILYSFDYAFTIFHPPISA